MERHTNISAIQNKHHKYGIKHYILATPSGIVQRFAVYAGMLDDLGGATHTQKFVLQVFTSCKI